MIKLSQLVPDGVQDLLASDFEQKEQIILKLKTIFREKGFKQVQTPIFEYYDLFAEIKDTIEKDRMIKLIDPNGKILVLRPDATIPIARMVAANYKLSSPVQKYSYCCSIFRMTDETQNVQSREITQAGVEWFGINGEETDAKIIALAIDSIKQCGAEEFTIDIGQANFYKALVEQIDLPNQEMSRIQKLIESKNFAQLDRAVRELPLPDEVKKALLSIPSLCGEPRRVIEMAKEIAINQEMQEEILQLQSVYEKLIASGYEQYLTMDLGLITHLNYYTSIVFQGYITGYGKPVIQGGRYDNLTSQFGLDMKATGFAVYVDDLIGALTNF